MTETFDDRLLASAVRYLAAGEESDAATVLLMCKITTEGGQWENSLDIYLTGPRTAYSSLLAKTAKCATN